MWSRIIAPAGVLCLALLAGPADAGPNPNRGKTLFRTTCKTCHVKGGEAKDLSPLTKTQAQWKRVFASAQIQAMVRKVQATPGKTLSPSDVADMQVFLVAHAADSDQPETCGVK